MHPVWWLSIIRDASGLRLVVVSPGAETNIAVHCSPTINWGTWYSHRCKNIAQFNSGGDHSPTTNATGWVYARCCEEVGLTECGIGLVNVFSRVLLVSWLHRASVYMLPKNQNNLMIDNHFREGMRDKQANIRNQSPCIKDTSSPQKKLQKDVPLFITYQQMAQEWFPLHCTLYAKSVQPKICCQSNFQKSCWICSTCWSSSCSSYKQCGTGDFPWTMYLVTAQFVQTDPSASDAHRCETKPTVRSVERHAKVGKVKTVRLTP